MNFDLKTNFSWNEKVSSGLVFILIMLLSSLVAWLAVSSAQEIISDPPQFIIKDGAAEKYQ